MGKKMLKSQRFRIVREFRTLDYGALSQLTGIDKKRLERHGSVSGPNLRLDEVQILADWLIVDWRWLEGDEGVAGPSWASATDSAEARENDSNRVGISEYDTWRTKLQGAWDKYMQLDRDAVKGPSVRKIMGNKSFQFANYFRSDMCKPVDCIFSVRQQWALARQLGALSKSVTRGTVERWHQEHIRRFPSDFNRGSITDAIGRGIQWPLPLVPSETCYARLIALLSQAIRKQAGDEGIPKRGRPSKRTSPEETNDAALLEAFDRVRSCRFPDDVSMILTEAVADYRSFNKMKRNLTNAEPLDLGHEGIDAFIRMKTGRIATLSDVVESARINGVTERAVHADLSSAVENKIIAIPRSKEKRDFVLNVHADDVERILHLRNSRSEVVWSFTKRNVRH